MEFKRKLHLLLNELRYDQFIELSLY